MNPKFTLFILKMEFKVDFLNFMEDLYLSVKVFLFIWETILSFLKIIHMFTTFLMVIRKNVS